MTKTIRLTKEIKTQGNNLIIRFSEEERRAHDLRLEILFC